ncbi:MAG: C_GCAxxG_C_C family protein [Prolixibacteraceae bacterium]|nr:C_GCAxxG_C_C family protein [Prolixibacteraceae bacterium]MBN2648525.1 C_GCAxxG_C_C family protein [Prolixibacteraceae bacterium]
MDRRNAMKITAGLIAGGGIGMFSLASVFKHKPTIDTEPHQLNYETNNDVWGYTALSPEHTARLAYQLYPDGSCMYATFRSVISQLAEIHGEPFASYPYHMFRYGHGGVGGFGTICGALNGSAALFGLFVSEKSVRDALITNLFQWYEKKPHPIFKPDDSEMILPAIASNSVLCHASNTHWSKVAGVEIESKERKERCRRLTADVAAKVVESLNALFDNTYMANTHNNQNVESCMACHGNEGKLKNTAGKMDCNSCHDESFGHKVLSDVHYRMMKE